MGELGLNENKISDSGATAIAEALTAAKPEGLRTLDLGPKYRPTEDTNTIGDRGAIALAEALKEIKPKQLIHISLGKDLKQVSWSGSGWSIPQPLLENNSYGHVPQWKDVVDYMIENKKE